MRVSFDTFLDQKPLYYKEIDHERVHHAYAKLKQALKPVQSIHIVGTNGKGSTGRILAHLANSTLCVGHFSSPHILKFNERIWIDGSDVSDALLEEAHQKLFSILGSEMSEALSYFEYTTLLAFVVFEKCDLMVLEAGLGGEFDATNVYDKVLSIITPIGIDHQAFLGETIEEIATTKIRSVQKAFLMAKQPYEEVLAIAKEIAIAKEAKLYQRSEKIDSALEDIATKKGWGNYLLENAQVALDALDILEISYRVDDLNSLELFGRFYKLGENIRIDVGHNPLAAQAIEKALSQKVVLIYNSLDDKDYNAVLKALKPKIKRVEFIEIDSQRASTKEEIVNAIHAQGLEYADFDAKKMDENEEYLVFGSFYVVEKFIKTIESKIDVSK